MKVLLTGANGFVGSQVLALLLQRRIATRILLRESSRTHLIASCLSQVEVQRGAIGDLTPSHPALDDITHVIHCAGATKALKPETYFEVNLTGTERLLAAINGCSPRIQRLIHISSLAALGPAPVSAPAGEDDAPHPVSAYGRSKLAAENAVREQCRTDFVILRPSAVYGPGDADFLTLFKTVAGHVLPKLGGGRQPLSLVFVRDLAEITLRCLDAAPASRRTYHVASPEVVTAGELAEEVARQLQVRAWPLPLPLAGLWPICVVQEAFSQLTGRPSILNRERYRELSAPGWVCDVSRLQRELGAVCRTHFAEGAAATLAWYRQQGWLATPRTSSNSSRA